MSQINRPPGGLQQLLGSQNFGKNPDQLAQTVQPTLDLFPFFGSGLLRVVQSTGARVNEGLICNVEFFGRAAIVAVSLEQTTAMTAAEPCQVGFALTNIAGDNPDTAVFFNTQSNVGQSFNASSLPAWAFCFPNPLLVESGTKLGAYFNFYAGVAETMRLRVLYYDLEPNGAT